MLNLRQLLHLVVVAAMQMQQQLQRPTRTSDADAAGCSCAEHYLCDLLATMKARACKTERPIYSTDSKTTRGEVSANVRAPRCIVR